MKKIILIDNYDSFTFNLYHYLSSLKVDVDVIRNDQITSNEILKNLPKSFEATRYHSLIIEKKSLSKHLEITAESKDGIIMGVQHKEYDVHGVQFHPESIKTKLGIKILKNFIKI